MPAHSSRRSSKRATVQLAKLAVETTFRLLKVRARHLWGDKIEVTHPGEQQRLAELQRAAENLDPDAIVAVLKATDPEKPVPAPIAHAEWQAAVRRRRKRE